MKSKKISSAKLKRYSGVVIVTDHDKINYYSITKNSKLIFDCRGRINFNSKNKSKLILL